MGDEGGGDFGICFTGDEEEGVGGVLGVEGIDELNPL